ncbi:MAG: hypothetical protein GQ574_05575 [Crocinitomix sp.]|nr:hypothetical protein [Crocinitomix sp.]
MKKKLSTLLIIFLNITHLGYGQVNEILMPYLSKGLYGFANAKGEVIIEPKYDLVSTFIDGFAKTYKSGDYEEEAYRYGLINQNGQVLLEPIYRSISAFDSNGLAKVVKEDYYTYGIIDKQGNWIVPIAYSQVDIKSGFIQIKDSTGRYALLDYEGHTVIDFKFNYFYFHNRPTVDSNLIIVRDEARYGLIRLQNNGYEIVIEPQYEDLSVLNNQHLRVAENEKYGVINSDNDVIIPFEYDNILLKLNFIIAYQNIEYEPKFKIAENNPKYSYTRYTGPLEKEYDDENKIVYYLVSKKEHSELLSYDYDLNGKDNKKTLYSLFDSTGQSILPAQFNEIRVRDDNLIEVKTDEGVNLYNKKGERISSDLFYYLHEIHEGAMVAQLRSDTNLQKYINYRNLEWNPEVEFKYGFVDATGKIIVPIIFDDAHLFNKGIAPVKQNGKWALVNKKGGLLCDFKYDHVQYAGENRYAFQQGELWGLLNLNGQEVVPATYVEYKRAPYKAIKRMPNQALTFKDGVATICNKAPRKDLIKTLIDTNGVKLFPFKYNEIVLGESGLYHVKLRDEDLGSDVFGIVELDDKEIVPVNQRGIDWLPNEKLFKVLSQDYKYYYYNRKGEIVDAPYEIIARTGLRDYKLLDNGFYSANNKGQTVYFTPDGIPLFEE